MLIFHIDVISCLSISMKIMEASDNHFLEGKWTLESRDNLDAFLAARGVGWLLRKFILGLTADLEYLVDKENRQLVKRTHSSYMGTREETLPFPGSYEPAKTLSGKPEVGCVSFEEDCVVQEMSCKETGGVLARIERRVLDGKLVVTLISGDVTASEVYVKAA